MSDASNGQKAKRAEDRDAKSEWMKVIGSWLTPITVAAVGFFATKTLQNQQAAETNVRAYADLMSRREQADSSLRKDMFKQIIESFVAPGQSRPIEDKVLDLELLAYNFHDSLDLAPLLQHVYRQINANALDGKGNEYLGRLERLAWEVNYKQISALEDPRNVRSGNERYGNVISGTVTFDENGKVTLDDPSSPFFTVISGPLELPKRKSTSDSEKPSARVRHFTVYVQHVYPAKKEVVVRVTVSPPDEPEDRAEKDISLPVGYFNFPMIDNTRLSNGERFAVVLNRFYDRSAQIALVYFPGDRASVKDKPYYDEVMENLLFLQGGTTSGG